MGMVLLETVFPFAQCGEGATGVVGITLFGHCAEQAGLVDAQERIDLALGADVSRQRGSLQPACFFAFFEVGVPRWVVGLGRLREA
nr:hypothetical protein BN993_05719 [Virgibacillus halodenitrificans]